MTIFLENTFGDTAVLKTYRNPAWIYSHITIACRLLGPLVMVAMWALAVTAFTLIHATSGIYLLFIAILLIFQEFSWLFGRIQALKRDNCMGSCWRSFVWFDSWKRSLEYFIFAVVAFVIGGFSTWPLFVGGGLLLLLAIVYLLKARRFTKIEPLKSATLESLPGTNPFTGGLPNNSYTSPRSDIEWGSPASKY